MLFDSKVMFCHNESIVASGIIGDELDLMSANQDLEIGEQPYIGIVVSEDLAAGADDLVFTLQTSPDGGVYTDVIASVEYAVADIIVGKEIKIPVPAGMDRWAQLTTTVTTPTAGKITAGFVM